MSDCGREEFDKDDVYRNHVYYSLPTRVGNWNNSLALKEAEEQLTAFKSDHCQLLVVKTRSMLKNVLEPVTLSTAIENILYGDLYQIYASELSNSIDPSVDSKGLYLSGLINERNIDHSITFTHGCLMSASPDRIPCKRNAFRFVSSENKTGVINYGEDLFIKIHSDDDQPLYVQAEYSTIDSFGDHLYTRLSSFPDVYCHFKILDRHPRYRKDSLGRSITPNTPLIIQHVASGRNLAAEVNRWMPTFFGYECVVSCHTFQNSNRVETDENVWRVIGKRKVVKGDIIRAAKGEKISPALLEEH